MINVPEKVKGVLRKAVTSWNKSNGKLPDFGSTVKITKSSCDVQRYSVQLPKAAKLKLKVTKRALA